MLVRRGRRFTVLLRGTALHTHQREEVSHISQRGKMSVCPAPVTV